MRRYREEGMTGHVRRLSGKRVQLLQYGKSQATEWFSRDEGWKILKNPNGLSVANFEGVESLHDTRKRSHSMLFSRYKSK